MGLNCSIESLGCPPKKSCPKGMVLWFLDRMQMELKQEPGGPARLGKLSDHHLLWLTGIKIIRDIAGGESRGRAHLHRRSKYMNTPLE